MWAGSMEGMQLSISGTGFGQDVMGVSITVGDMPCQILGVSTNLVTCRVPPATAEGPVPVQVMHHPAWLDPGLHHRPDARVTMQAACRFQISECRIHALCLASSRPAVGHVTLQRPRHA